MSKKKKIDEEMTILQIVELAEAIGWKTLAIAKHEDGVDVTGLLIGDDDFINGFKAEIERTSVDEIKEAFVESVVDESGDPEDPDDTTYH